MFELGKELQKIKADKKLPQLPSDDTPVMQLLRIIRSKEKTTEGDPNFERPNVRSKKIKVSF